MAVHQMRVARHGTNPFRMSKKVLFDNIISGFAVARNSLLKRDFDSIGIRLLESGIVDKLIADNIIGWREEVVDRSLKPLSLSHFLAAFLIWGMGFGICVIVFVLEKLIKKKENFKNQNWMSFEMKYFLR